MTRSGRIRRARAVLVDWRDGELILRNYQTQESVSAAPEAVRILHLLENWTDPPDLYALLPEYTPRSIRAGLRELLKNTLVVREGTPQAKKDAELASVWSDWLPQASFHFATKDVEYLQPPPSFFKRYLAESPQPALLKSYSKAPRIRLPVVEKSQGEFAGALLARKTHRDFSGEQIPLNVISTLLYYTWGVTGKIAAPPFGRLFHKTSPSGGARHPGEVYLLAMRVGELTQGLYHYDGLHHSLARLRSVKALKKAVRYAAGQEFVARRICFVYYDRSISAHAVEVPLCPHLPGGSARDWTLVPNILLSGDLAWSRAVLHGRVSGHADRERTWLGRHP